MYKYLIGTVTMQKAGYIVLENNKVGYLINVANPYLYEIGKEYKIFVYNHVKEDENSLYGFATEDQLDLFLKLISVKGLGPKMANIFFASGSTSGIIDAINRENILYLTKFPKIGEKIARQMILDLKGKLESVSVFEDNDNIDDLVSVLESLGYKQAEIKKVIKDIDFTAKVEDQVKEALKLLLK